MKERSEMEQLVHHVCCCKHAQIPESARQKSRLRMLDVLGCAFGGAYASGNQELLKLLRQKSGPQKATVWVYGGELAMEDAALMNSVLCRSYDFEVMTPAHLYAAVIPTAIAVGEAMQRTEEDVLDAIVLATDLCARVVQASGMDAPKGFDPAGTSTLLGTITAAGRLMELNEKELLYAYGHGLNMMCGSFENMWAGATSFKFNQGWAAWCGIFATKLARIGWTAPTDPLLGRAGYYKLYTSGGCAAPEHLTCALGSEFYDLVIHKPYPSCRFNHSAIQCALALRRDYLFQIDSVKSICISLPAWQTGLFVCAPFEPGEAFPEGSALFNMRFNTACALIHGEVKPHLFTPQFILEPAVAALCEKVIIQPLPQGDKCQGRMEIILQGGQRIGTQLEQVKGDVPGDPMTREEFEQKFWYNLDFNGRVPCEQGKLLLTLCETGRTQTELGEILQAMVCRPFC